MQIARSDETPPWGILIDDSFDAGWRTVEVRRWRQHPWVDTTLAADDAQLVTTLLSGWKVVDVCHGRRWERAIVGPGTVSATPPGQATRLRWKAGPTQSLDHLSVRLPAETMRRVAAELSHQQGRPARSPDCLASHDPLLPSLITALYRASRAGETDLYAESAVELMAVHLLSTQDGRTDARRFARSQRRVRTIETLLHESVAEPLSLARIAATVGLSRSQVVRVFQHATGQTPARYLTCLRMELARTLLTDGHLAIAEIARRTGYADASQFARAFRRETGVGPLSYRDRHW